MIIFYQDIVGSVIMRGVEEEAHGRLTRCSILHLGVLPVPLAPQEGERGPRDQQLAEREHQGLPAGPEISHRMK